MKICAHIGLHKTGSTWLQDSVFPVILMDTDWQFLGGRAKVPKDKAWGFLFDFEPDRYAGRYMISCENLSGSIDMHRRAGESWLQYLNFLQLVQEKPFGIPIILGLRDHYQWLVSAYLQTAANYIKVKTIHEYAETFTDEDLSWSKRIRQAQRLKGPVFFYFLEELAQDGESLVADLCEFLDIEPASRGLNLSKDVKNARKDSPLSTSVYKGVRVFGRSASGRVLKKTLRGLSGGKIQIEYDRAAEWASKRAIFFDTARKNSPVVELSKARREFLEWDMAEAVRLVEDARGRKLNIARSQALRNVL